MGILLVLILVVPLLGAVATAFVPQRAARSLALAVSLAVLAIAVVIAAQFDFAHDNPGASAAARSAASFQFNVGDDPENPVSVQQVGFSFRLGIDSISLWLLLLTAFLQPLAIAASFGSITERPREYYAWMLALLGFMLGVFAARDALLFYVFFELTLVPMFFIIGIWGGPDRRRAAGKFFLFTFAGGVLTLASIVWLGLKAGSFDIAAIVAFAQSDRIGADERFWALMGLIAGMAVKVPLFPVHTWLPLAHTEAPTAGSVILAGVLLKLGTYGLLRLALPVGLVGPDDAAAFPVLIQWLGGLCVVGIIYGALVAWVQQDIKKLVAYSSVSHLGFCVLGLLAMNTVGIQGSVLYMINHGLSTGAMFLVVGMIYDRYHTRDINALSGLGRNMPVLSFFFVLFALSSIGLPGTNGFVSEFLTILAAFKSPLLGIGFGATAALGVILGAVYMLHMVAKVIFGPLKVPTDHGSGEGHDDPAPRKNDLNGREVAILVPLAAAVLFLGVLPSPLLRSMRAPAELARRPVMESPVPAEAIERPRM